MSEIHAEQTVLESIISGIVDDSDSIKIIRTVDEMGVLYTVSVAKEDVGKIIGKAGNTAKAIRSILKIIALKHDVHATMKIDAPLLKKRESSDFAPEVQE